MVTLKAQKADSIFGSQGATKTYVRSKINAIPASATPGGSTGEFQYNNGGAFGGTTQFTYTSSAGAHGIYLTNTAKNASYEFGYNNTTEESYLWSSGVGNIGGFKLGLGAPAETRFSMAQDGRSSFTETLILQGGVLTPGGASSDYALFTTNKVLLTPTSEITPAGLGIPDSDPGVIGELFTLGAPSPGTPKAVYMSGG